MSYTVKECFISLQGEGHHAGRRAVFCRFAGCNLWSGREADRGTSCSAWCDTDFVGTGGTSGGRYEAAPLVAELTRLWGPDRMRRLAVLTGGEPALQVDSVLLDTLRRFDFIVQIETNGTRTLPPGIDWITLSPKAGAPVVLSRVDELKVVYPQAGLDPESLDGIAAAHRFIQPMWTQDEPSRTANLAAATHYCLDNPRWRLGIQLHKFLGIS